MSLAGHGPKSGSRHVCPSVSGWVEAGDLSTSNLPLLDNAHSGQNQQQINVVGLFKGAISFISAIAFRGISTLIIPKFLMLLLLIKLSTLGTVQ